MQGKDVKGKGNRGDVFWGKAKVDREKRGDRDEEKWHSFGAVEARGEKWRVLEVFVNGDMEKKLQELWVYIKGRRRGVKMGIVEF